MSIGPQARPTNGRLSAEFCDRFGKAMQALARPARSDQIIVADPGQDAAANISRMHDDIHVAFDAHRLVLADVRPLDDIVALAMTVQPLFFRPTVLAHEV